MYREELKQLYLKNLFQLFLYFQYSKIIICSIVALFIFTMMSIDHDLTKTVFFAHMAIVLNSLITLSFKKFFLKNNIFNVLNSLIDLTILFVGTQIYPQSFQSLFLWIAPLSASLFLISKKEFSLIVLILFVIGGFILNQFFQIDQEMILAENFELNQSVFLLNTLGVSILLFIFFYISSKLRSFYNKAVKDLISKLNSALSFPSNNPFPILEFNSEKKLISRNISGANLLKSLSQEKFIEIEKKIISSSQYSSSFFNLQHLNKMYHMACVPYEDQINIYMMDITEIEEAKRVAIENEQYAKAIINAIPGFVSWVDSDFNYLGVNKKLQDFFDKDETDFIGKKVGAVNDEGNDKSEIKQYLQMLFASDEKYLQKELSFNFNGERFHNIIAMNKYNDNKNAVLVSIDITEVKKMEEKIKDEQERSQASAKLASFGEMAAGIAHEINNPMSVISGMIGVLKKLAKNEKIDSQQIIKISTKIENSIDRIIKIIKGMKNLSRDGNNDPFEFALLSDIVDESLTFFHKKCKDKNISLTIKDYPTHLGFECQTVQIGQVLVIILNNSIDAIENLEEKWIMIEIKDLYHSVLISVRDSGNGINSEILEKIFSPFFTTKPVGKGTGLGLSLAHRIVKYHNGEIRIDTSCKNTKIDVIIPKKQNLIAA